MRRIVGALQHYFMQKSKKIFIFIFIQYLAFGVSLIAKNKLSIRDSSKIPNKSEQMATKIAASNNKQLKREARGGRG
jgi:hypothetical protein